jgi:hypothetical protein
LSGPAYLRFECVLKNPLKTLLKTLLRTQARRRQIQASGTRRHRSQGTDILKACPACHAKMRGGGWKRAWSRIARALMEGKKGEAAGSLLSEMAPHEQRGGRKGRLRRKSRPTGVDLLRSAAEEGCRRGSGVESLREGRRLAQAASAPAASTRNSPSERSSKTRT